MSATECCMREWNAGFVDGLAFAVFVVLFIMACLFGLILAEARRRP